MGSFVLFLIVAAFAYWWFIRRNKGMAEDMGKLVEHGVDIEAKVVSKTRSQRNRYLVYSFTLGNRQSYSKQVSPDFAVWDSLNKGDKIPIVYLPENPEVSAIKQTVEKVRAAMRPAS